MNTAQIYQNYYQKADFLHNSQKALKFAGNSDSASNSTRNQN